MHKSEIRTQGGTSHLYIDGVDTPAMAYTTYFHERSRCADFADIGCRLFFVNVSLTSLPINSAQTGFTPFHVGVFEDIARPDYSELEAEVRRILAAAPDAVIFPRIYVSMPSWWVDAHPDECVPTEKGGRREALFSESFRRDGARLLEELVEHVMASDYAYSIGGWQICGGQTQEWFHHNLDGSISPAAEEPYRRWVEKRYGESGATLPSPEAFVYRGTGENTDENAIRYVLFCNEEVARSVDLFAEAIKNKTGRRQIVGAFYGYSFECCGTVLFGSHALRCLLDSPNIDFFSSPNTYYGNRGFGIDWADMIPVESVKLHGKLCFIECDVRTHLTRAIQDVRPGEYPDDMYRTGDGATLWVGPPTRELSREALRKCFAHQITRGSAIWWFDMWGGWYDDPMLMNELAEMRAVLGSAHEREVGLPAPEVVFFADESGYAHLFSGSVQLGGIAATRLAMGNTGVPFDTFMAEDAERVLSGYRAAVFPMPVASEAGRRAMELCRELGIPFLCASVEHCALDVDEIRAFYRASGIHFYTEQKDVVYLGNGYLGLHAATGGLKRISLPHTVTAIPIFGTDVKPRSGKVIELELEEHTTALFRITQ